MDRIGGFSSGEINELVNFMADGKKQGKPLTTLFKEYGATYGRSAGSVRNFYYQLLQMSVKDEDIKEKYLKDKTLKANKIKSFDNEETQMLLKSIIEGKNHNQSVRRTLIELGGGDERLVLRYQNKFRNTLKTNPELIKEVAKQMNIEDDKITENYLSRAKRDEVKMRKLREEINSLVERISNKVRDDNENLKARVKELEEENQKLQSKVETVPITLLSSTSTNSQHKSIK